jgi:hypothetical protein
MAQEQNRDRHIAGLVSSYEAQITRGLVERIRAM